MLKQIRIGLFALCVTYSVDLPARATEGFDASLTLSMTQHKGNTDSSLGNASLLAERKSDAREWRAGIEFMYGELDGEKNTENGRVFAGLKEIFSDRWYGATDASAMYDPVADVDYRAIWSGGIGYFLVKNETSSLTVDAGPAYVWERIDGAANDYLALRLSERFERNVGENAKIWQAAEYIPEAEDFDNYLLSGEVGVEAMLNSRLSLRTVYRVLYDNTPAPDARKSDRQLLVGVVLSL